MPSTVWLFALTIFTSAFLLFQVQPLVSKQILPWFGGSPAVWTTAMLFFQSVLFAGYAYAHALSRLPSRRWQARIHIGLLIIAAVMASQVLPSAALKPVTSDAPVSQVLTILALSVGLPYLCLATTGPLVQHWFTATPHASSVFRLYALSNIGSFLALLSFPYLFEPWFDLPTMARLWTAGFWLFALLCVPIALGWRQQPQADTGSQTTDNAQTPAHADTNAKVSPVAAKQRLMWALLPALASLVFIAVTDQVSHDVAPEPRIWVTTLGLYLLTFVLTFDHPRWYRPRLTAMVAIAAILITTGRSEIPDWLGFEWDYGVAELRWMHYILLLAVCMLCHGELYRRRPTQPRHLTEFYLWMSLGGAFGGLFVTLVATPLFDDYHEWLISLVIALALAWLVMSRGAHASRRLVAVVGVVITVGLTLYFEDPWLQRGHQTAEYTNTWLDQGRNFYGTVSVKERRYPADPQKDYRIFVSGSIEHGQQFLADNRKHEPSTYYSRESGIGETMLYAANRQPALDVALVGLGAGTLANYARPTDSYDFYEINPEAIRIARTWFSNLQACQAREQRMLEGDARLVIEHLPADKRYDIIVLDAFTGGSVPVHLLTREAFAAYSAHLKPNGFIAINITNAYLNLYPVVKAQAELLGMGYRNKYQAPDHDRHIRRNQHFVMTRDAAYLQTHPSVNREYRDEQGKLLRVDQLDWPGIRLWTDQFSSIQHIAW